MVGSLAPLLGLQGVQAYFLKTPVATATSFVARLMRVSQKDPGFRRFRPRRSQLDQRRSGPVNGAREKIKTAWKSRSCGHFDVAALVGIASPRSYCLSRVPSDWHEGAKPSDKIRVCAA